MDAELLCDKLMSLAGRGEALGAPMVGATGGG
jgi:hypothetical protein